MKIPAKLKQKYEKDHLLTAFSETVLGRVQNHIRANRCVFFPEYTDHGVAHIEDVIGTAADLATRESMEIMQSADAVTLIVAVALHDLGMHLTRDGFFSLIDKDSQWVGSDKFDDPPWFDLWNEFLSQASRFDGRKLEQLFGPNYRPVRPPPSADTTWDEADFLLVGEFLRRHHPRLAYEIAKSGLPGKAGSSVEICSADTSDAKRLTDLAGTIARSHGMPLRSCIDYLNANYGNRVRPAGVCAVYLMALLRIADYFQIQAARAPANRTSVDTLRSPFSSQEWRVHQCVNDITDRGEDPESIFVHAIPQDVETYLKLKKWQDDLQAELDASWAVLGEVYGRQDSLSVLGMKVRRVRTNLSDKSFLNSIPYVPKSLSFDASSPELLSLLISPLYGGKVDVGVRELVQNATDAVREFNNCVANGFTIDEAERVRQKYDVEVRILLDEDEEPAILEISDRGSGMSIDIISRYFLRAGASFRRSDDWGKDHLDPTGDPKVLRSGRFGVGALAAFLLGNEIEVFTRHFRSRKEDGLFFKAKATTPAISVFRRPYQIGTLIRISLSEEGKSTLNNHVFESSIKYINHSLGPYFLPSPSVGRFYGNREIAISSDLMLPAESDSNPTDGWSFINDTKFKVFWRYKNASHLFCNGIPVCLIADFKYTPRYLTSSMFRVPSLSILDRYGLLPLNLQRNMIEYRLFPFEPILSNDITDKFIAYSVSNFCKTSPNPRKPINLYPGLTENWIYSLGHWLFFRKGMVLNEPSMLHRNGIQRVIICCGDIDLNLTSTKTLKTIPNETAVGFYDRDIFSGASNSQKGVLGTFLKAGNPNFYEYINGYSIDPIELALSKSARNFFNQLLPGKSLQQGIDGLIPNGDFLYCSHNDSLCDDFFLRIVAAQDPRKKWAFCNARFNTRISSSSSWHSPLEIQANRWVDHLPYPYIPFDDRARDELARSLKKPS